MTTVPKTSEAESARGIQLCLIQLAREARSLGLGFAAAHMDVAALEIADHVGDSIQDLPLQRTVANDPASTGRTARTAKKR
jgi:hypothetical protein